ncbi:uncharacterized protein LOC106472377 isoform X2 [Limulus polyphemus]|uniref:Uncharacterized protein LOC106472377 isoform X2 n=1 Tax=Limulus polyphemus TaxID=6850 RepID=A0ABM1TLB4_LIMPO|nr:uncharacterized protein LOC106472377 isoform X2 [Limulus polyphemus]XP_022256671.1 uncharacterized protein LOC106472377 isoform X2 [Limulus polyphemus]
MLYQYFHTRTSWSTDIILFSIWKQKCTTDFPLLLKGCTVFVAIEFYAEKWKMRAVREKNKMNEQSEIEGKQAPIESWGNIVKKNVHLFFRNDDYSEILAEVLKAAKTEEYHETPKKESEPDFQRLYSYLVNLLEGDIPPDLPPAESEVIILLLKDLAQVVKYPLFQEEKEFLRTFNTEEQEKFTTGQTKRQEQQEVSSSPNHIQNVSCSSGGSSRHKRSLKLLPNTIKSLKVQNCFNPLKIPVSLPEKEMEFIKKWRINF